ncbi:T9SS type A sorting domain-containing protein [Haliscomenobacter sp.]|uniref:T9SS type A sorting domain-containing protein n=1 Tax=Haliscomenobacter sp. TaxID=2717303 RepID=UPI0035948134
MKFYFSAILSIACLCLGAQSLSPQVLSNAGSTIVTPEMRLSWTLGEVAVSRVPGNAGSLTEGFHQPSLQVNQISFGELQMVQVVPNPVRSMLNLISISDDQEVYLANLQDAQGRVLIKDLKLRGKAEIDMSAYPAGVYLLSVHKSGSSLIQNHKVVKL